MNSDSSNIDETKPAVAPSRFQFSIRAMLIATTVVAGLCWVFLTASAWVGAICLLIGMLLFMPAVLAALVYGRGRIRAFAVGAMPPTCLVFLWFTGIFGGRGMPFLSFQDELEMKIAFVVVTIVIMVSGFVGQAVRAWCER